MSTDTRKGQYERDVLCPTCGMVIDHYWGDSPEPAAMIAAMLFNDSRADHGQEYISCAMDPKWVRGWDYGPVEWKASP